MPFTAAPVAPTPDEIFEQSKLRWARLGYRDPLDLTDTVEDAVGYVTWITGRYFDDFVPAVIVGDDGGAVNYNYTPVRIALAPELIRIMKVAVRMRVEQLVKQEQPGYIDTATDDLISSMSVGSYSESRRDTSSLRGGRQAQRQLLNSWPELNDRLMQLMTDERREYWNMVLNNVYAPSFSIEEVDWSLVGKDAAFSPLADVHAPTPNLGYPWWG